MFPTSVPWLLPVTFVLGLIYAWDVIGERDQIFLPELDEGRVSVRITADRGINLARMDELTEKVEKLILSQPEVDTETDLEVEANPDLKKVNLVEFSLPQQTNPDFVLIRMIRPQYPANASEAQRRMPVINVEAAIYIEVTGQVTASMILSSNGGPVFDEVVLQAVNQWLYRPIIKNGQPPQARWQTLTWRFWSPYLNDRTSGDGGN